MSKTSNKMQNNANVKDCYKCQTNGNEKMANENATNARTDARMTNETSNEAE